MKYSFVLPVYNREKLVKSALLSLINQNFSKAEFEIVVVDDNSVDASSSVVNEIINAYSDKVFIKYFKNDINLGVGQSRDRGVSEAKGEVIIQTEDDTYYPSEYLSIVDKEIVKLEKENVKWGTLIVLPRKSSNFIEGAIPKLVQFRRQAIDELTKQGKRKIIGGWIFKKSLYEKVGGYQDLKIGEDVDLVKRIKEKGYENLAIFSTYWSHCEPTSFVKFWSRMFKQGSCYKDFKLITGLKSSGKQKIFWLGNFIFLLALIVLIAYLLINYSYIKLLIIPIVLYLYCCLLITLNRELRFEAKYITISPYWPLIFLLPVYYGMEIFGILAGRIKVFCLI